MPLWTAEQVDVSDLHGNAVFYLVNPLEIEKPSFAAPHYVGCIEDDPEDEEQDQYRTTWIVYTSEADQRTYWTWRYRRATPHQVSDVNLGDMVWIMYTSEADRQSYFRKEKKVMIT